MPSIQDGRAALKEGNLQQARLIFETILQETPRNPNAWLGLADVLTESEDKRICYENVLKIDKTSQAAKEGLRNLEPQANPLIAALQEKTAERDDDLFEDDDDDYDEDPTRATMVGAEETYESPSSGSTGPPVFVLVAIGLVLSVVVFALGGGVVFLGLTALTGS